MCIEVAQQMRKICNKNCMINQQVEKRLRVACENPTIMHRKGIKMKKRIVAIVLSMLMMFFVTDTTTITADAASKFTGSKWSAGFDNHDWNNFEVANGWSNGGMFDCTWRDANVWFSDGKLNLKIDRDTDGSGYSGGEYRTNQTFGYGMFDVSMKPIKNSGVVTSFFTYTGPSDGTVWDEIDIEFLGKDTTKVQFNYYTNGVGNHEYLYNLGFDASQSYHQYGFYWGPGYITWYVDGKAVYTATSNIPTTPGKIMLNVWPGTGVDSWLGRYDGRTPLVGTYDWISYTAPEAGSGNSGSTSSGNNNSGNNNSGSSSGSSNVTYGQSVTVEAEKFSYMSGVEVAGGTVGYIDPGDWMSYDVNVPSTGTYSVEFKVASAQGSSFRLEKNSGTEVLANVTVPNTGDWGTYKSVYADVYLTSGKNTIGIATDRGGFNIDKMVFTEKNSGSNARTTTYTAPATTTNNNNNNNSGSVSFNSGTAYKIISKKSGKALDVSYGKSDNGTNILQYTYNGYGNQKWYIQKNSEGYYVIKNVQTGKVVDVEARSTADGGNILQWQDNGGWNQQWSIEKVGDAYRFKNRNSGKILDVEGGSTADNANVCQWSQNGGENQLWYISTAN